MTQIWFSATEHGALRFIRREVFLASWPQPPCGRCPWPRICTDLLHDCGPEDLWMVRDPAAATSDGHTFDYCARNFTDGTIPPDVRVLRHRLSASLKDHVQQPGPPAKRPRERIAPRLRLVPVPPP